VTRYFKPTRQSITDKAKGINNVLQERYQKAYNKALDKAMEVENVKKESRAMLRGKLATGSFMGGLGASGIIAGASGQMSSIFRSMGMKEGAEFFEQAAVNFDIGDTEIKGWKDILDPKKARQVYELYSWGYGSNACSKYRCWYGHGWCWRWSYAHNARCWNCWMGS
jgi:hypothetical protein